MLVKVGALFGAVIFAATALETVAGTLGLIAGIVISSGVILAAGRSGWRFMRRLEAVIDNTNALPEFIREQKKTNDRVDERLDDGGERMERIEAQLGVLARSERAAVRGAIEAFSEPRPSRRTDPEPRTGWRE